MSLHKVTFSQENIPNPDEIAPADLFQSTEIVQTTQPSLNETVQESDSVPAETVQEIIPIPAETVQEIIPIPAETVQMSISNPNESVQVQVLQLKLKNLVIIENDWL